jgi:hypothetical protein
MILRMKPGHLLPRSPDAFHKWSDEHRTQVWNMIEKLGKGEVSYKEARELLREEKKALNAIGKNLFGVKTSLVPLTNSPLGAPKVPKAKRSTPQRETPPARLH